MTEPLFEPINVMGMELKNRLLHAPTTMNMSDPYGYVTDRIVAVYERIAAGGTSLTTVGATCVRWDGLINERMLGLYDDAYVIGFRDVVEAIHNNDSYAGIQLFYGGLIPGLASTTLLPPGRGWIPNTVSWGASDKAHIGNPQPMVIPTDVMEEIVESYGQGARRAREAGFDCVAYHMCHGSLPMTNLSLLSNVDRTDKYADRFLFCEEIIQRTQQICGKDYPIIVRICCDENLQGGYDLDYFAEHYAPRLQRLGVAIIDCTFGSMIRGVPSRNAEIASNEYIGGGFYTPNAVNLGNIRRTKQLLKDRGITTPILGSCRIGTPEQVRQMAYEGGADFVGMCRAMLADPDFPRKMAEGREREIRKITWTGASLLHGNIFGKGYAGSPENAEFGRDREYELRPPLALRKVVIVGGGSGGMELARVAKELGHEVVLFERSRQLGGVMDWAGNYPHLPNVESIRYIADYLSYQMELVGVDCRLGIEATPELILTETPDVVVLAIGARAKIPPIPGFAEGRGCGRVLTMDEVMAREGARDPGRRVVVWGAGEGMELALEIVRQGREVRLLDTNPRVIPVPYLASRMMHVLRWLKQAGVEPETSVTLRALTPSGLWISREGADQLDLDELAALTGGELTEEMRRKLEEIPVDSVIVCQGREPVNDLRDALQGKVREVRVLGDARRPRSYGNAIHEAAYIARHI